MNYQLPIFLGMSKPILEHIFFCHQEESSSEVKKKFDDIFDPTHDANALKNNHKIKIAEINKIIHKL